jgi:hypothetical protein
MIDLAPVASAEESNQGISRIACHKVLEWAGYPKDEKISLLELMVERDGRKGEFIATAQQTLPMAGPLFKLKDRYPDPLRIDIESTDIREITSARCRRDFVGKQIGQRGLGAFDWGGSDRFFANVGVEELFRGWQQADESHPAFPTPVGLRHEVAPRSNPSGSEVAAAGHREPMP